MSKLGNYIKITNGFPFKSENMSALAEGLPIIKIKELKQKRVIFTKETLFHPYLPELNNFLIDYNDILIALTGNPVTKPNIDALVGRCSIYRHHTEALLNQRVCKVESRSAQLLNKYLFYFLSRDELTIELASHATGSANQANISSNDILDIEISLPTLTQQQHIVDITRTRVLKSLLLFLQVLYLRR